MNAATSSAARTLSTSTALSRRSGNHPPSARYVQYAAHGTRTAVGNVAIGNFCVRSECTAAPDRGQSSTRRGETFVRQAYTTLTFCGSFWDFQAQYRRNERSPLLVDRYRCLRSVFLASTRFVLASTRFLQSASVRLRWSLNRFCSDFCCCCRSSQRRLLLPPAPARH